ncbi:glycosyltransferase [Streptomyces sp. NPDC087270]|uniref:glycosyltransferase n=1 Tax=Streptomyces sp. NPDC087270 TaxID=3365774 RepID=UPI00381AFC3E
MPVLYSYLNLSNGSNLLADSGFVFQESLLRGLRDLGWETVLIGPPGVRAVTSSRAVEVEMPDSKYAVRYSFPWSHLEDALASCGSAPDALLVNQPELAVPLSALIAEQSGRKVPTGVYYHYLPIESVDASGDVHFDPSLNANGLAGSIWARQVEAAHFADLLMIGSEWGRRLFLSAAPGSEALADKLAVVPPPTTVRGTDVEVVPATTVRGTDPRAGTGDSPPIPTFLYNHRLYAHYGTTELFDWFEELAEISPTPFRVVVTNPTGRRSARRRKLDSSVDAVLARISQLPFVSTVDAPTRSAYEAVIARTDIGVAPLRAGALWSMAVVDVMASGRPVLGVRRGAIPEIIGDDALLFADRAQFLDRAMKLIADPAYAVRKGAAAERRSRRWAPEQIAERVSDLFTRVDRPLAVR